MYLVGLHIYCKMIHGPYNIKIYLLSWELLMQKKKKYITYIRHEDPRIILKYFSVRWISNGYCVTLDP